MHVVDSATMSWETVSGHRVGGIWFKRMLTGLEDRPDNFEFSLVKQEGAFHSPVHRHNFDQLRVVLEGRASIGRNTYLHPGEVGYFPEGAFYGPQDQDEPAITLALQFGGASGQGFMSYRQLGDGHVALQAKGRFEAGRFTAAGATDSQDAYEAIWEHVRQRALTYPEPRYRAPVIMNLDAFAWRDVAPGVRRRALGRFTERGIGLEQVSIATGTRHTATARASANLLFVMSGRLNVAGSAAPERSAVHLAAGESVTMAAVADAVVLVIGLPEFDA